MLNKPGFKAIKGWVADEETIAKAINPPFHLTSDDGRIYELVSWSPTITLDDPIKIKMEVVVRIPDDEREASPMRLGGGHLKQISVGQPPS